MVVIFALLLLLLVAPSAESFGPAASRGWSPTRGAPTRGLEKQQALGGPKKAGSPTRDLELSAWGRGKTAAEAAEILQQEQDEEAETFQRLFSERQNALEELSSEQERLVEMENAIEALAEAERLLSDAEEEQKEQTFAEGAARVLRLAEVEAELVVHEDLKAAVAQAKNLRVQEYLRETVAEEAEQWEEPEELSAKERYLRGAQAAADREKNQKLQDSRNTASAADAARERYFEAQEAEEEQFAQDQVFVDIAKAKDHRWSMIQKEVDADAEFQEELLRKRQLQPRRSGLWETNLAQEAEENARGRARAAEAQERRNQAQRARDAEEAEERRYHQAIEAEAEERRYQEQLAREAEEEREQRLQEMLNEAAWEAEAQAQEQRRELQRQQEAEDERLYRAERAREAELVAQEQARAAEEEERRYQEQVAREREADKQERLRELLEEAEREAETEAQAMLVRQQQRAAAEEERLYQEQLQREAEAQAQEDARVAAEDERRYQEQLAREAEEEKQERLREMLAEAAAEAEQLRMEQQIQLEAEEERLYQAQLAREAEERAQVEMRAAAEEERLYQEQVAREAEEERRYQEQLAREAEAQAQVEARAAAEEERRYQEQLAREAEEEKQERLREMLAEAEAEKQREFVRQQQRAAAEEDRLYQEQVQRDAAARAQAEAAEEERRCQEQVAREREDEQARRLQAMLEEAELEKQQELIRGQQRAAAEEDRLYREGLLAREQQQRADDAEEDRLLYQEQVARDAEEEKAQRLREMLAETEAEAQQGFVRQQQKAAAEEDRLYQEQLAREGELREKEGMRADAEEQQRYQEQLARDAEARWAQEEEQRAAAEQQVVQQKAEAEQLYQEQLAREQEQTLRVAAEQQRQQEAGQLLQREAEAQAQQRQAAAEQQRGAAEEQQSLQVSQMQDQQRRVSQKTPEEAEDEEIRAAATRAYLAQEQEQSQADADRAAATLEFLQEDREDLARRKAAMGEEPDSDVEQPASDEEIRAAATKAYLAQQQEQVPTQAEADRAARTREFLQEDREDLARRQVAMGGEQPASVEQPDFSDEEIRAAATKAYLAQEQEQVPTQAEAERAARTREFLQEAKGVQPKSDEEIMAAATREFLADAERQSQEKKRALEEQLQSARDQGGVEEDYDRPQTKDEKQAAKEAMQKLMKEELNAVVTESRQELIREWEEEQAFLREGVANGPEAEEKMRAAAMAPPEPQAPEVRETAAGEQGADSDQRREDEIRAAATREFEEAARDGPRPTSEEEIRAARTKAFLQEAKGEQPASDEEIRAAATKEFLQEAERVREAAAAEKQAFRDDQFKIAEERKQQATREWQGGAEAVPETKESAQSAKEAMQRMMKEELNAAAVEARQELIREWEADQPEAKAAAAAAEAAKVAAAEQLVQEEAAGAEAALRDQAAAAEQLVRDKEAAEQLVRDEAAAEERRKEEEAAEEKRKVEEAERQQIQMAAAAEERRKEEELKLETERLEAERLEAERKEAERKEAERKEAERLELERQQNETAKQEEIRLKAEAQEWLLQVEKEAELEEQRKKAEEVERLAAVEKEAAAAEELRKEEEEMAQKKRQLEQVQKASLAESIARIEREQNEDESKKKERRDMEFAQKSVRAARVFAAEELADTLSRRDLRALKGAMSRAESVLGREDLEPAGKEHEDSSIPLLQTALREATAVREELEAELGSPGESYLQRLESAMGGVASAMGPGVATEIISEEEAQKQQAGLEQAMVVEKNPGSYLQKLESAMGSAMGGALAAGLAMENPPQMQEASARLEVAIRETMESEKEEASIALAEATDKGDSEAMAVAIAKAEDVKAKYEIFWEYDDAARQRADLADAVSNLAEASQGVDPAPIAAAMARAQEAGLAPTSTEIMSASARLESLGTETEQALTRLKEAGDIASLKKAVEAALKLDCDVAESQALLASLEKQAEALLKSDTILELKAAIQAVSNAMLRKEVTEARARLDAMLTAEILDALLAADNVETIARAVKLAASVKEPTEEFAGALQAAERRSALLSAIAALADAGSEAQLETAISGAAGLLSPEAKEQPKELSDAVERLRELKVGRLAQFATQLRAARDDRTVGAILRDAGPLRQLIPEYAAFLKESEAARRRIEALRVVGSRLPGSDAAALEAAVAAANEAGVPRAELRAAFAKLTTLRETAVKKNRARAVGAVERALETRDLAAVDKSIKDLAGLGGDLSTYQKRRDSLSAAMSGLAAASGAAELEAALAVARKAGLRDAELSAALRKLEVLKTEAASTELSNVVLSGDSTVETMRSAIEKAEKAGLDDEVAVGPMGLAQAALKDLTEGLSDLARAAAGLNVVDLEKAIARVGQRDSAEMRRAMEKLKSLQTRESAAAFSKLAGASDVELKEALREAEGLGEPSAELAAELAAKRKLVDARAAANEQLASAMSGVDAPALAAALEACEGLWTTENPALREGAAKLDSLRASALDSQVQTLLGDLRTGEDVRSSLDAAREFLEDTKDPRLEAAVEEALSRNREVDKAAARLGHSEAAEALVAGGTDAAIAKAKNALAASANLGMSIEDSELKRALSDARARNARVKSVLDAVRVATAGLDVAALESALQAAEDLKGAETSMGEAPTIMREAWAKVERLRDAVDSRTRDQQDAQRRLDLKAELDEAATSEAVATATRLENALKELRASTAGLDASAIEAALRGADASGLSEVAAIASARAKLVLLEASAVASARRRLSDALSQAVASKDRDAIRDAITQAQALDTDKAHFASEIAAALVAIQTIQGAEEVQDHLAHIAGSWTSGQGDPLMEITADGKVHVFPKVGRSGELQVDGETIRADFRINRYSEVDGAYSGDFPAVLTGTVSGDVFEGTLLSGTQETEFKMFKDDNAPN